MSYTCKLLTGLVPFALLQYNNNFHQAYHVTIKADYYFYWTSLTYLITVKTVKLVKCSHTVYFNSILLYFSFYLFRIIICQIILNYSSFIQLEQNGIAPEDTRTSFKGKEKHENNTYTQWQSFCDAKP